MKECEYCGAAKHAGYCIFTFCAVNEGTLEERERQKKRAAGEKAVDEAFERNR